MSLYSHMSLHFSLLSVACLLLRFSKRHVTLDVRVDVEVRGVLCSRYDLQVFCKGENNWFCVPSDRNCRQSYVWPSYVT